MKKPFLFKLWLKNILCILCFSSLSFGFGQNKVQYLTHKWQQQHSKHLDIYFHEKAFILPEIASQWTENAYDTLSNQLKFTHKKRIPLIIYGNPTLFAQTNIIGEILPEGVGGFTEIFKTRIAIPFNGSYNDFRHVLHHELFHAFVFGIIFDQFGGSMMLSNAQIPLWFNEGAAEYLSSGWGVEADMFMMEQTINSTVPLPGPGLGGYLAYKGGQSFLKFLHSSRGDIAFSSFLRDFRKSHNVEKSIEKVYQTKLVELGKEWIQELRRIYWPEIGKRERPTIKGTAITSHLETRDHFNLRPKISPDGKLIAFFSDRKDFTRILITDRKGKIVEQINQNGYGGYFESFHPFRSGLSWSSNGSQLMFVTQYKGQDEIRIIDIKQKKLLRTIRTDIASISSPVFSKNDSLITFSGISNGYSDLFIYNLQSDSLNRLTESIQFEEDPHFSPDGKTILFSVQDTTISSDIKTSPYGSSPSELASIDITSKKITLLTNTPWNEKSPSYSADGKNILFVSDRNGIENLYISPVDSIENAGALTNYIGGCSNPDWCDDGKTIVFSLYQQQGWDVWSIDDPMEKLIKTPLSPTRWVEAMSDSTQSFFAKVALKTDHTTKAPTIPSEKTIKETSQNGKSEVLKKDTLNPTSNGTVLNQTTKDSLPVEKELSKSTREHATETSKKIESISSDSIKTVPATLELISQDTTIDITSSDTTLPKDSVITATPELYRLKFTPDLVSVGVGLSNYYSPAGQLLMSFSDIMGDHQFIFAGDLQGNFKDYLHLYASYIYLKQRFDLGVGGYYSKDYSNANIFGDHFYHDTEIGGFFFARYPFSLLSRVDLEIYTRNIKRVPIDFTGPTTDAVSLLPSLSYTFDNILWGLTGPLNGIRAKSSILFSPQLDFIDDHFISFDIDVRTYHHLFKRFVWANRVVAGASLSLDDRGSSRRYFLGGNDNWISYDVNREQYEKNLANTLYSEFVTPFRGFNYIDISGSRVAVYNTEFRFPFIKEISIVWPLQMQVRYLNGAIFADIGNAWDAGVINHGLPLPDKIYGGFGFGLRADLGIFILRFDRGWPTDWTSNVGRPINYFSLGSEF